ncbi:hypothetical protein CAPTEDRAFT_185700 [Capitella teleta]|uniref:Uncharacterized protein n=1 Tax=Capitella teleta TaxID=283909 RepID=R7UN11_CAPTE|nr:hypothetical protein CAPTEDRAFT_185700 [Capitella teleta]|eukprot:ELU04781.1 hypothetical protein CAPTEDRAFT_185700 [Capitella teleta]
MAVINTVVLKLACSTLITLVDTLSFSDAPYGAVVSAAGGARVVLDEYEVVIVRSHPKVIRTEIMESLRATVNELLRHLSDSKGDTNLLAIYRRRYVNLRWSHIRHKRWAPLEPDGNLVGNVFGLSTSKDMNEVKDRVNRVISSMGNERRIIQGLVVAVNDTFHGMTTLSSTVRSLTERAVNVKRVIENLGEDITEVSRGLALSQGYLVCEAILSLFEFHKANEVNFHRDYQLQRDLAEIGHVTEDLIAVSELRELLQDLNSPLDVSYIYRHFPIHLLSLSDTTVAYAFSIPRLDPEMYTAWSLVTVAYHSSGHFVKLSPELDSVAIGHTSGSIIDTKNCSSDLAGSPPVDANLLSPPPQLDAEAATASAPTIDRETVSFGPGSLYPRFAFTGGK